MDVLQKTRIEYRQEQWEEQRRKDEEKRRRKLRFLKKNRRDLHDQLQDIDIEIEMIEARLSGQVIEIGRRV